MSGGGESEWLHLISLDDCSPNRNRRMAHCQLKSKMSGEKIAGRVATVFTVSSLSLEVVKIKRTKNS